MLVKIGVGLRLRLVYCSILDSGWIICYSCNAGDRHINAPIEGAGGWHAARIAQDIDSCHAEDAIPWKPTHPKHEVDAAAMIKNPNRRVNRSSDLYASDDNDAVNRRCPKQFVGNSPDERSR
jgi:hypothetical protein